MNQWQLHNVRWMEFLVPSNLNPHHHNATLPPAPAPVRTTFLITTHLPPFAVYKGTGTSNTMKRNEAISPGLAWLTAFIPALSYFLATRFSSLHGGASSLGTTVTDRVESVFLQDVLYLPKQSLELQHPLQLVDDSFQNVVATMWRHDSELRRGYLLLSQAKGNGRIWRWERGGGPIPIGKTLAMDPSGCRSKLCQGDLNNGSGGMAIDFYKQEHYREGALVVAEWGEGRIVRLQDKTGVRTPLVILVPDACKHASAPLRRIERPIHMLYTPYGDLIFIESTSACCAVMRLNEAVHVPPLESAMTSRMAHKWNETHHDHTIDVLYKEADMGSMALDSKGEGLYVTVKRDDASVLLVHLNLAEDDNDEEESDVSTIDTRMGLLHHTERVECNLTEIGVSYPPQAMALDGKGHVFLAVSDGILVLKLKNGKQVLGKLASPTPITSLTLGEDNYLYITTASQLLRIYVRHGPPKLATNLVKKSTIKMKVK